MEKILNQEEIDALIRAAQNKTPLATTTTEVDRNPKRVNSYTWGQAGRINLQQVGSVSLLHDTFARSLSERLAAFLRVSFEVNLVSVEQLSYTEFLQRTSEVSYLASIDLQPTDAIGLLDFDLNLAFPIIDLLLGGPGKCEPVSRDVTEIEEQILESVMKIICQELQVIWKPLVDMKFAFDERQPQTQAPRLMPPNERVLSLRFEMRMPDVRGSLNLAFPALVSGALLRKISEQWLTRKHRTSETNVQRRALLESCRFSTEMTLRETLVRGSDLLALEPGQVLVLQHRVTEPLPISVAGKKFFTAYPVQHEGRRSGLIEKQLKISFESERDLQ